LPMCFKELKNSPKLNII